MISAGDVKPPAEYKIGSYKFIDNDGDGKLSRADSVEISDTPKAEGGEPRQIAASTFALMAGNPKLLGTSFATLKAQAKKFLPDAKKLTALMSMPKDDDALVNRTGVKKVDPPVSITITGEGDRADNKFMITFRYEYVLPKNDIGARRFLSNAGYRFIQSDRNPEMALAVHERNIEEAARKAISPYALDSEIRDYILKFRRNFVP